MFFHFFYTLLLRSIIQQHAIVRGIRGEGSFGNMLLKFGRMRNLYFVAVLRLVTWLLEALESSASGYFQPG